jgi:tellurite resistance protein
MVDLDQTRSIYELMVLTAWADGNLDPSEVLASRGLLTQFPELRQVHDQGKLAKKAKAKLDLVGLTTALGEAAAGLRDKAHRERAFICCARMLEADGKISVEEFGVLAALRELFALSNDDVARLLQDAAQMPLPDAPA